MLELMFSGIKRLIRNTLVFIYANQNICFYNVLVHLEILMSSPFCLVMLCLIHTHTHTHLETSD